jgi:hypothetical protein
VGQQQQQQQQAVATVNHNHTTATTTTTTTTTTTATSSLSSSSHTSSHTSNHTSTSTSTILFQGNKHWYCSGFTALNIQDFDTFWTLLDTIQQQEPIPSVGDQSILTWVLQYVLYYYGRVEEYGVFDTYTVIEHAATFSHHSLSLSLSLSLYFLFLFLASFFC